LAVYRRTVFKNYPTSEETVQLTDKERYFKSKSIEEMKQYIQINWRLYGRVNGIGIRGVRFFEFEAIEKLKREGLLDLKREEEKEALRVTFGDDTQLHKLTRLILRPGRRVKEEVGKLLAAFFRMWILCFSHGGKIAYRWGPEAMAEFSAGVTEGMTSFLDADGQLVGETSRANIYKFLLMAWPEIKELQESNPPITRNDFNEWVKPFARCGFVSINDLDQLLDVCDDIHLKFAGRGAPRKKAE
jgi:hypothetical protein